MSSRDAALLTRKVDEESVRQRALRRLVCDLCHVVADSEENMLKHLNGGPHLKELSGYREDLCRRNAETGLPRKLNCDESGAVLPNLGARQEEWRLRYTPGGKCTKRDVQTIEAIKERERKDWEYSRDRDRDGGDLGQYRYRHKDFYCDICDVYVGTRNMMLSHMSGKEHMR